MKMFMVSYYYTTVQVLRRDELSRRNVGDRQIVLHDTQWLCWRPSAASVNPRTWTPGFVRITLTSGVEMAAPSILLHASREERAMEGSARSRSELTSPPCHLGRNCLVPVPSTRLRKWFWQGQEEDKVGPSRHCPASLPYPFRVIVTQVHCYHRPHLTALR